MKKKIVALLAAIAAVLGFGFATSTAMAAGYGETATVSGNVATIGYPAGTFTANAPITVTADDTYVSDVKLVAMHDFHPGNAKSDGSANLQYTLTNAAVQAIAEGKTVTVTATDGTHTVETALTKANIAQTGEGSKDEVAQTGASVAPYAVAVVLLAAAGCAVFAARKAGAR